SPKGGVGRSVLAANLAIALKQLDDPKQQQNHQVVLLDANLQSGDAHVLLNLNAVSSIDDLRDSSGLDPSIISEVITPHEAAHIGLRRAPLALESAGLYTEDVMKTLLEGVRNQSDYLVVDADSSFSEATLAVLDLADLILLVTTLEVTAINRVSQFFEVIDRRGLPRNKVRLVCNRVDSYFVIQPRQVETRLHQKFVAQIPDDVRLVVASVNRGVPFVLSHRNAPISRSIQGLAEKIADILLTPPEAESAERRSRWSFR